MKVVGVAAKVANDRDEEAVWELFANSEVLAYLQGANLSEDIISVYYEYEGHQNDSYTLLIGYEVNDSFEVPLGLNTVSINFKHQTYKVEKNLPDAIFEKWQEICEDSTRKRAYIADFDRYNPKEDFAEISVEYK